MMISNLQSARALIQADLDHARKVLELWSQQVSDLERALEQIDSVGESRQALKEQYTGGRSAAPRLMPPAAPGSARGNRKLKSEATPTGATKKQRAKSPERSAGGVATSHRDGKAGAIKKAKKAPLSGKVKKIAAQYKDPNSDKTWSGRGRRPAWFVGDPEQYKIQPAAIQQETATASSAMH
jgi:hypothetical protein